jgi:hypothetical protein
MLLDTIRENKVRWEAESFMLRSINKEQVCFIVTEKQRDKLWEEERK